MSLNMCRCNNVTFVPRCNVSADVATFFFLRIFFLKKKNCRGGPQGPKSKKKKKRKRKKERKRFWPSNVARPPPKLALGVAGVGQNGGGHCGPRPPPKLALGVAGVDQNGGGHCGPQPPLQFFFSFFFKILKIKTKYGSHISANVAFGDRCHIITSTPV
jgi:hypothetical protein